MQPPLNPSLWRTCRVLANRRRLRLLSWIFQQMEITVTTAAQQFGWPLGYTSSALRLLQSRGLLSVQRSGRIVCYFPTPDPTVPFSSDLLEALRCVLFTPKGLEDAFATLTAFTHPRRLEILRALARGIDKPFDLLRITSMSFPALNRHLAKLRRRGFVTPSRSGRLQLTPPSDPLGSALISSTLSTPPHTFECQSSTPPVGYQRDQIPSPPVSR